MFEFDNTYANQLEGLYAPWKPETFPQPGLVILNDELADELNLDRTYLERNAAPEFAGGAVPDGATPIAQAYAGHQFGAFSPQLGDGRAILLGELLDRNGHRRDLQLKGSGRTPFSRGGDGRATLGPVLREYLMGEAMHRLGVPTTRALAAVKTGELVMREGALPGAMLVRIAASHLRVGTFEFFAAREDVEKLSRLVSYALRRHYPDEVADDEGAAEALLRRVAVAQGELVAEWMLIGFVHGVMNTDNSTISGETIDYGPCAFIDAYDPNTVFSSIDRRGRYAYGNQPGIGVWNVSRLGAALAPVLPGERKTIEAKIEASAALFARAYRDRWLGGMRKKLGLRTEQGDDLPLVQSLLELMHADKIDLTSMFRRLATSLRDNSAPPDVVDSDKFGTWSALWRQRLAQEDYDEASAAAAMDSVNPIYIPRNHLVEEALTSAIEGDLSPFHELLEVLSDPYVEKPALIRYATKAPAESPPYITFCGT